MALTECSECGREVSDQAAACPQCGAPIASTLEAAAKRKGIPTMPIVIVLVLLAAVGVGFVVMGQNRAAQSKREEAAAQGAETKSAIDAVRKVDAAVTVGINYQDYSGEVRDALAAVQAFDAASETQQAVKAKLLEAVECYDTANDAWGLDVQDDWSASEHGRRAYWTVQNPSETFASFFDNPNEVLSVDDVRQAAWAAAGQCLDEAEMLASQ